jgi:hypothetical protein
VLAWSSTPKPRARRGPDEEGARKSGGKAMPHPTEINTDKFQTLRDAREWVVNKFQFDDVGSFGTHENFEDAFSRWIYDNQRRYFNDAGEEVLYNDEIFSDFLKSQGQDPSDWI